MVSSIGSSVWTLLGGYAERLSGFFTGIWEGIKKIFSGVGNWFKNIFKGAFDGMQHQIVLDTGTLVGETAPAMDRQLGLISKRKTRGGIGTW